MIYSRLTHALLATGGLFVISCQQQETGDEEQSSQGETPTPSAPAQPPAPEVLAALESQEIGKKLLGKTVYLQGDQFVKANLPFAPEYYLVHWSASW